MTALVKCETINVNISILFNQRRGRGEGDYLFNLIHKAKLILLFN